MKLPHIAIIILSFTLCVTTYLLTKIYNVRLAEAMQPIVVYESYPEIKIVESSKVKPLKRKLKRVAYEKDSLKAENIRKDGIIGDEKMFPKVYFTEPFSYQLNLPQ